MTSLHRKIAAICVLEIVVILVGAGGATADATDPRALNMSLLDAAKKGDAALVESRLLDGASISTRDRFGNTALIYAARGAHVKTARVLIEAGADTNQANVNGNSQGVVYVVGPQEYQFRIDIFRGNAAAAGGHRDGPQQAEVRDPSVPLHEFVLESER